MNTTAFCDMAASSLIDRHQFSEKKLLLLFSALKIEAADSSGNLADRAHLLSHFSTSLTP